MTTIRLPYGTGTVAVDIPKERIRGILVPGTHAGLPDRTGEDIVRESLEKPIGSRRLRDLAQGKKRVVIIASDHTRPVPSRILMPALLGEIREGDPGAGITILIATGCHRAPTRAELRDKFGEEILRTEKIVIHDCDDGASLVNLGLLPSGGDLVINRLAVEADLLVAEGFIEPHFFAGFSGGRKSVLPGIAGRTTVLANHCAEFIAHDRSRTGVLEGNPIQQDMLFAARAAKLAFILNVVIDSDRNIIKAVAGDPVAAHRAGAEFIDAIARVRGNLSDIVLTTNGGHPLDQNLYQAVKGMTTAEACCREGGVIIMVSRCGDGHGGESFFRTFRDGPSAAVILDGILRTPRDATAVDQWQSQIHARNLRKATIIMVTDAPRPMVEALHMKWAPSVEEAIRMADEIIGRKNAPIMIIPDGVAVIPAPVE
jgi:lactate racemase